MSKKKSGMQIYTKQDKAILYCGYALLALFLIAIIVPMIYIVIASFMDPVTLQNKGISFDFSKWSLDAYERVISDKQIWVGFKNAVLYSVIFTVISVAVTMLAAYPMSLPDFKGKKFFNTLFVITMFFNGSYCPPSGSPSFQSPTARSTATPRYVPRNLYTWYGTPGTSQKPS